MTAAGSMGAGFAAPSSEAVMARMNGENFPVSSVLLPRELRCRLEAIYGFARLVDELGDSAEGDRLAALDWLEGELLAAQAGRPESPLMRRLAVTIAGCNLPIEPFLRLIEANRVDQRVKRYETWEQLASYCELSANPVGELVLGVFGLVSPRRVALSDKVCTALQLIEHCQDVAEDLRSGRIYVPREDMERFGCGEQDLARTSANAAVRRLICFECERSASLLEQGMPLLDTLSGRPRLAVAGFIAGGAAALKAIEQADFDVLGGAPKAGRGSLLLSLAGTLLVPGRRPRSKELMFGRTLLCTPSSSSNGAAAAAHAHCASVTRSAAANFYYGIALLPQGKRQAMCAVYAYARRIDDIGDGELPRERKLALLEEQQALLAGISVRSADPVIVALADAHRRFGLPIDALGDLIEGVRMDVLEARYETFEELVLYCRRVAGSIGRLSLAIFGSREMESASALADDLGVAMQLTNILRDVREDAERGRVYLPSEDLLRYHLRDSEALGAEALSQLSREASAAEPAVVAGLQGGDVGQLFALMRFQALRAHAWFGKGLALVPLLDRRSASCVMAMTGIYRRLLCEIQEHPEVALSQRMSLPVKWKAWVAIASVLGPHRVPERPSAERML